MRLLTVVLTLLVAACSSCAAVQTPGTAPTLSDPAVAKLVIMEDGETVSHCTVFKVDDELVMTAGHCCEADDPAAMRAYTAEGPHAIPGAGFEALRVDTKHDVCVLKGKLKGASIPLALHDPTIGATVWTAGYPKTIFLISSGFWSGRDDDSEGIASLAVYGGASGSPVMDDQGRLVGILRAYYPPMVNMAVIAPIEHVRTSLMIARVKAKASVD